MNSETTSKKILLNNSVTPLNVTDFYTFNKDYLPFVRTDILHVFGANKIKLTFMFEEH